MLTLNASHPLYGNIVSFICPNESGSGLVDLKNPSRTLVENNGTFSHGSGQFGRHVTPTAVDNTYILATPAIIPSSNNANASFSAFVVCNGTSSASGGGANQPLWYGYNGSVPVIEKTGGFAAITLSSGTAPAYVSTSDVVQNGAYSLAFNYSGSLAGNQLSLYVNGLLSASGTPPGGGSTAQLDKVGSAQGFTRNISQFVYWIFFNKNLTESEITELHASLGANNQISLLASGIPPTGTVTIGTIVPNSTGASAPFTYDAADQTSFEYQLNETGTIYPIAASPATPTGLTSSTGYTIRVRAKNDSGEGAWSASAPFTTSAAGSPPAGTFTVGTITTTQTTASVPYTYSAADQTSIEYRIDGGAAITASASPQSLAGLTAGTTYGIQFRAVNAFGNGAWSTSAPFTTAAVPVGTITITDIANNTDTPWISSAVDAATVMPMSLGSIVVNKTGLSTTAGADLVITDAAIITGTEYIIILKIGTAYGWYRAVAT